MKRFLNPFLALIDAVRDRLRAFLLAGCLRGIWILSGIAAQLQKAAPIAVSSDRYALLKTATAEMTG